MNKDQGHVHIVNQMIDEISDVFVNMGFEIASGNESEDEYHNFDALNFPKDHPARDMQDTFWLKNMPEMLLRTHTSNAQIRYMKDHKPPLKIVAPGKCYRYEATDKTHEVQFYQLESLAVAEDITLQNLKYVINQFIQRLFGKDVKTRFRPGYFPFVEPGLEVDMKRPGGDWIEVLGSGMVHPNVLNNVGIDPKKYSGYAFGAGIERLAIVKYGIDDIRNFHNGDLRFVNQF